MQKDLNDTTVTMSVSMSASTACKLAAIWECNLDFRMGGSRGKTALVRYLIEKHYEKLLHDKEEGDAVLEAFARSVAKFNRMTSPKISGE